MTYFSTGGILFSAGALPALFNSPSWDITADGTVRLVRANVRFRPG